MRNCAVGSGIVLAIPLWPRLRRAQAKEEEAETLRLCLCCVDLFPSYRRRETSDACSSFEGKLKGMSKSDILKEYGEQLRSVGKILGQKLNHIRISCIAILVQMITLSVAVGLLTYMYVTYQIKHSVPPPPCPNSHDITMAVFFPSIIPQCVKRCTYLGRRFFLVFFPIQCRANARVFVAKL